MTNPNEQEWYEKYMMRRCTNGNEPAADLDDVIAIVAEAERRGELKGRVAAWEEVKTLVSPANVNGFTSSAKLVCKNLDYWLDTKLTQLKKV